MGESLGKTPEAASPQAPAAACESFSRRLLEIQWKRASRSGAEAQRRTIFFSKGNSAFRRPFFAPPLRLCVRPSLSVRPLSDMILAPTMSDMGRTHSLDQGRPPRLSLPVNPARDHLLGRADAPVTLVEYGDYECPDCGRAYPLLAELKKRFGDQLLFVFRHPKSFQARAVLVLSIVFLLPIHTILIMHVAFHLWPVFRQSRWWIAGFSCLESWVILAMVILLLQAASQWTRRLRT